MAIDWRCVKKGFEKNATALTALAKVHGCKADTIRKKAAKEGWKRIDEKVTDSLELREPASHGASVMKAAMHDSKDGRAGSDGSEAPQIAFDDHQSLWHGVKKRLVRGLETSDVKAGLEELKVAKLAGEVLTSVIKGERLAHGLSVAEYDDAQRIDGDTAEMEAATMSRGAGEAVDGE